MSESVIVTDTGFAPDDLAPEALTTLAPDTDPNELANHLGAEAIALDFPSFADGRGFTLARLLREAGFAGRLRARGHVISDQYAMARRAGFDEVEISREQARRQPWPEWQFRSDWQKGDYQSRMRG